MSKEKYGYNAEQALGMLFWHKHDLDRAIQVSILFHYFYSHYFYNTLSNKIPKRTGFDLNAFFQDLANFTPFPDEWTVEDKVLFEQVIFLYSRRCVFFISAITQIIHSYSDNYTA